MSQSILIPALIVLFVVVRFLINELRERHLSTTQLFVLPGIIGAVALLIVVSVALAQPARLPELGIEAIVALAIGIALGFAVAHFTTVRTGEDGRIFFRGSYATVAIWICALLLRFLARYAAHAQAKADTLVANAALFVLVASALTAVRVLVRRKAIAERSQGSPLAESAI